MNSAYLTFINKFTEEEQEAMLIKSAHDRYMGGSGIYDDDYDQSYYKKLKLIEDKITEEMKEFMKYNHWRTWYPEYHKGDRK